MASGVYKITCLPTKEFYVGSADDVARRWSEHRRVLRRGRHETGALQELWDEHGEANFSFEMVEQVQDRATLAARELYYIRSLSPSLNKTERTRRTVREEKVTTTVRLREDTLDKLKIACRVLRRSQSDLMADALQEYFDKYKLDGRYQLHVHGKYVVLLKSDGKQMQVVETKEVNGVPPEKLVEQYRVALREPVALMIDKAEEQQGEQP